MVVALAEVTALGQRTVRTFGSNVAAEIAAIVAPGGKTTGYVRTVIQGCPIGIPKNPEISGSSRKSSLDAAEEVHSARAKYKVGGGGGVSSRTQYERIRRLVQTTFFSVEYRDLEKNP